VEILLLKDVDNLGYAGDVKKVANGFGRNYLLPHNLATLATPGALKQAETIRRAAEKYRARELEDAKAIANQLKDLKLTFERRSGEMGKLYGSVTSAEVAQAIVDKTGITIDKRKVVLAEPIRQLGDHEVILKIVMDLSIKIQVEVLPEGGILERERAAAKEAARAEAVRVAQERAQAQAAAVLAEKIAAETATEASVEA
jgi:large subunit ribosomal protein L9